MDENYQDQEPQNASEEVPEFDYEAREPLQLDRLIHSLLVESSKTRSIIPDCLIRKVCETVGLECNEEGFYNLLGAMAEFTLHDTVQSIKMLPETGKAKVLSTTQVKKTLQSEGIFLGTPRIIPEMGISQTEQELYHQQE